MTPIDLFKLIPKYDVDKGGDLYVNYIQLYQDLINDLIDSNEDIYTIFDCINCEDKYLPYLAKLLGYTWDYTGDIETQRYELLSIVQRRKRVGTLWFFDDLFRIMGISYGYEVRGSFIRGAGNQDFVHNNLTSIISVFQGTTVYIEGIDWLQVDSYIDWSIGGAEPVTGTSYEIIYQIREPRNLVHHVLTLSGPETLSGDFYIEGLEKYHEGAMEIIIDHAEIPGLYDLIRSAFPAGIQLHVTFNA